MPTKCGNKGLKMDVMLELYSYWWSTYGCIYERLYLYYARYIGDVARCKLVLPVSW